MSDIKIERQVFETADNGLTLVVFLKHKGLPVTIRVNQVIQMSLRINPEWWRPFTTIPNIKLELKALKVFNELLQAAEVILAGLEREAIAEERHLQPCTKMDGTQYIPKYEEGKI